MWYIYNMQSTFSVCSKYNLSLHPFTSKIPMFSPCKKTVLRCSPLHRKSQQDDFPLPFRVQCRALTGDNAARSQQDFFSSRKLKIWEDLRSWSWKLVEVYFSSWMMLDVTAGLFTDFLKNWYETLQCSSQTWSFSGTDLQPRSPNRHGGRNGARPRPMNLWSDLTCRSCRQILTVFAFAEV